MVMVGVVVMGWYCCVEAGGWEDVRSVSKATT